MPKVSTLALPILFLTVSLALTRPRIWRIRVDAATAAVFGAFLTILTGAVPVDSIPETLSVLLYPVVAIVSLMILTLIAEEAGLFELLATYIAKAAKGDGHRLFRYLFFTGTTIGAVFTNDAAVLIFTPLVFKLIERIKGESWSQANKIPYYFAVLYVANLVGAFVISNPINIIVASFFAIGFMEYARWMILPAVVSMVVSYWSLKIFFRRSLPRDYDRSAVDTLPGNGKFMALSGVVLSVTLVGFFTEHLIGIPTWAVAAIGAGMLLVLARAFHRLDATKIIRGVGWDVIIFVVCIFLIVSGIRNAGLTNQIGRLVLFLGGHDILGLTVVNGLVTSIVSALMNNHPTAYAVALSIEDMKLESGMAGFFVKRMLVFSALIGGDLGPKMLPIGSLAALLWFRMLRDRGVEIPYSLYVRIGVPVSLCAVLLSVLTLNLQYLIVLALGAAWP